MVNSVGSATNLLSLLGINSYSTTSNSSGSNTTTTNALASFMEQYQPSTLDSTASSWDLLTQTYSPQSVLNNYNQQQTSGTSESYQQEVLNELQTNPNAAMELESNQNLSDLLQLESSGGDTSSSSSPDSLFSLAADYSMASLPSVNSNSTNIQQAMTEIQKNPADAVQILKTQTTSSLLDILGGNLDLSI